MAEHTAQRQGLVVTRYGATVEILAEDDTVWTCHQRKAKNPVVAGDQVTWQSGADKTGIITKRLERKNILAQRKDNRRVKEIAANLDQIVIAFTVKPDYDQYLIDRYIAVAEQQGITPILLITKLDLITETSSSDIEQLAEIYRQIGYQVIASSQKQTTGLDAVRHALKDKISLLVGQSGVGKSSLATALLPETKIVTGVLTKHELGSHTTSRTTLYPLPFGGYLVDSPGVRDFAVWNIAAEELASCYIEFNKHMNNCRFHNCRHINEPHCGIKLAVEHNEISSTRYKSYVSLYEALAANT